MNSLHVVPFVRCSDRNKTEGSCVEECAAALCVCRTFWVMLGRWICGRSRVSSTPAPRCVCPHLYLWGSAASYRSLIMHGVRPWVQTSVSGNRPLMKKKIWLLLCRKPFAAPISFLSHALSSSLTVYLPSLPAESEFSNAPRLNFLAALGGCQSRPGSPAHKPPQQPGQRLSHKPSAPSLPFCQANDFCRQLASELTGCWLSVCPLSTATSAHPQKMALSPQPRQDFSICSLSDGKSKPSALNTKTVDYTKLTGLQTVLQSMAEIMHTNRFSFCWVWYLSFTVFLTSASCLLSQ